MSWRRAYNAYLFDLDGTLIDTAPDLNAALNHCLVAAGLEPVDEALTRHWVGHGARIMIQQALDHQDATHDTQPLLDAFIPFYADHSAVLSRPYEHVIETLESLRGRGAKLAVVTNKLHHLSERLLSEIGMRHYFDAVIGGDSTSTPKPHAAPVLLALSTLEANPAESLFVGDSETDVRAAQNADVTVVCLKDGYNHGVDVHALGADAVIESLADIRV